jgi:hypothetical protein
MDVTHAGSRTQGMGAAAPDEGEVWFYLSPWPGGVRASLYLGPISADVFVPDGAPDRAQRWEAATEEALAMLVERARALGANAVVSLQVELDPFASASHGGARGLRIRVAGTAAQLEPSWPAQRVA